MTLENLFGELALDATLVAIKDDLEQFLPALRGAGILAGSAAATGVLGSPLTAIDASNQSVLYLHLRGTFSATLVVEGTNDPAATANWTALTLHSSSSGARTASVKNAGLYVVSNLPRFVRVRCSVYTSGTAIVDVLLKPVPEELPARYISDADGLARWALTTFGVGIITQKTYLCGGEFGSSVTLDTDLWIDRSLNGGSLVFGGGEVELSTGTAANGRALVESVRDAIFLGGNDNEIQCVVRQGDTGGADHIFRFGVYDDQNGTFVEINSSGVDFKVRKNGVDASSAFGILGVTNPTNATSNQFWYITFNPNFIIFRQGSSLVQLFVGSASLSTLFADTTLPLRAEALNLSGSTSHSLFVQTLTANRLGQPHTLRANESFKPDDVLAAVASVGQGQDPDELFRPVRVQGRHSGNSTATALPGDSGGTDHIWRGLWFEWQDSYVKMLFDVFGDVPGTIYVDYSEHVAPNDGDESSVDSSVALVYDPLVEPLLQRQTPVHARWVRMRYENGPAAQSDFELDTAFFTSDPGLVTQALSLLPTLSTEAGIVRAITGISDGQGGFQEVPIDNASVPITHVTDIDDSVLLKPGSSWSVDQFSVGSIPVHLDVIKLPGRVNGVACNTSPIGMIWIGPDATVSPFTGEPVFPFQFSTMMLDEAADWYAVGAAGATSNTLTRAPSSGTGTAGTPTSALTSNDDYATIAAVGQTVVLSGFTAGTVNPLTSVKLGLEGHKQAGQFETVAFAEVKTGNGVSVGSFSTSASIAGGALQTYLCYVSRQGAATVTSITGLDLSWTLVKTQASDDGNRTLDLWMARGTATAGTVGATFSTVPTGSHIAVLRFTGVDQSNPVQANGGTAANSASVVGPVLAGTNKGMSVLGIAENNTTTTAGAGYTERSDESATDGLSTETKPLTATANETATATLAAAKHYAAIGATLSPAVSADPVVTISYSLSGNPGVTSGPVTLTSGIDAQFLVDISTDRSWVYGDIANITITITGLTITVAAAMIDQGFLRLVDTLGTVVRVSFKQIAGTP